MGGIRGWLTDPDISGRLLREEGEDIVDVVRKHWVVYIVPGLLCFAGAACWVVLPFWTVQLGWFPILAGVTLILVGVFKALQRNIDQFVITNMRVFRISGLLNRSQATMPLRRILDITVVQPLHGRLLGYGHFTFESAAQDQGLRDIRYVARPNQRDMTIQRVLQRSGLRGPKGGDTS